ncbi:hypothetical protein [Mesorhizobium sp. f-mel]
MPAELSVGGLAIDKLASLSMASLFHCVIWMRVKLVLCRQSEIGRSLQIVSTATLALNSAGNWLRVFGCGSRDLGHTADSSSSASR